MTTKTSKHQAKRRRTNRTRAARPARWYEPEALVFSASAWIKLQTMCQYADTEIGAFGRSADDDPLYIEDVIPVKQACSAVSVEFDDEAVADFFEEQVERGHQPSRFARTWIHTHPADSATPSATDEDTFRRAFGNCSWAVMMILARNGDTYCRLQANGGPIDGRAGDEQRLLLVSRLLPVAVDYATLRDEGSALPIGEWQRDVDRLVTVIQDCVQPFRATSANRGPSSMATLHGDEPNVFGGRDEWDLTDEELLQEDLAALGFDERDFDEAAFAHDDTGVAWRDEEEVRDDL